MAPATGTISHVAAAVPPAEIGPVNGPAQARRCPGASGRADRGRGGARGASVSGARPRGLQAEARSEPPACVEARAAGSPSQPAGVRQWPWGTRRSALGVEKERGRGFPQVTPRTFRPSASEPPAACDHSAAGQESGGAHCTTCRSCLLRTSPAASAGGEAAAAGICSDTLKRPLTGADGQWGRRGQLGAVILCDAPREGRYLGPAEQIKTRLRTAPRSHGS